MIGLDRFPQFTQWNIMSKWLYIFWEGKKYKEFKRQGDQAAGPNTGKESKKLWSVKRDI